MTRLTKTNNEARQAFNINDEATVTLTDRGKVVWRAYWTRYGDEMPESRKPDAKGKIQTELWKLFAAFGSDMYNGSKQLFKDNQIEMRRRI